MPPTAVATWISAPLNCVVIYIFSTRDYFKDLVFSADACRKGVPKSEAYPASCNFAAQRFAHVSTLRQSACQRDLQSSCLVVVCTTTLYPASRPEVLMYVASRLQHKEVLKGVLRQHQAIASLQYRYLGRTCMFMLPRLSSESS